MYKVAVLVGSLRKESVNLKFAKALAEMSKSQFDFQYVNLHELPMYNDDLWEKPPASVVKFKEDIAAADAVLFVTPEYNRSTTPVLINAIAWGSRPYDKNSWSGKPAAIVGASPGVIGTAAAQVHLRSLVGTVDTVLMSQPEVYLAMKPGLIDDQFNVTDEGTRKFFNLFLTSFEKWIKGSAALKKT